MEDDLNYLPDIQKEQPKIKMYINTVGVQNIQVPIKIERPYNNELINILSNVTMCVDLNDSVRGISMSRLHRTLIPFLSNPLKHKKIEEMLRSFLTHIGENSKESFIRFDFNYPIDKKSPVSEYIFPVYYPCSFEGRLTNNGFKFYERVEIQYASYCPCSESLCDYSFINSKKIGYPHAQRSFANVIVEVNQLKTLWIEDLVKMIENEIVTIPYPIIKRIDEMHMALIAKENTMFVEDSIRKISKVLEESDFIIDWLVKCRHEESIHKSDAISINWKGIENGLNGKYII